MKPIIEFEECLRDSPKFRTVLEENECNIDQLELKLERVIKASGGTVESGRNYVAQQNVLLSCLWDLNAHFEEDIDVSVHMKKFFSTMQEIVKFQNTLLDQTIRTLSKSFSTFLKTDVKHVKDSRHFFEKISADLDSVLIRNSQTQKNRLHEVEETQNLLMATRSCFRHTALDYVHAISVLQAKKRHEALDTLLGLLQAYSTYFHQGFDLFNQMDGYTKDLAMDISTMKDSTSSIVKDMENRHAYVTNKDYVPIPSKDKNNVRLEGYLFKRTSNAFKTWNRRWFILQNHQLVYRKRTGEFTVTVMEEDLRLCTVRPISDGERKFCFEVVSPTKSHILQADSDEMYQSWIAAMQQGIDAAIQLTLQDGALTYPSSNDSGGSGSGDSSEDINASPSITGKNLDSNKQRIRDQLMKIPGNTECCDCQSPNPQWASINLGITLCIECSGIHRSLGVHHSKVRSVTLDAWEPEILKVMAELGNSIVNRVHEACIDESIAAKATPGCHRNIRESWIKAKYVEKSFVRKTTLLGIDTESNEGDRRTMNIPVVRKWSVRKLRRRAKSYDRYDRKIKLRNSEDKKSSQSDERAGSEESEKHHHHVAITEEEITELLSQVSSTSSSVRVSESDKTEVIEKSDIGVQDHESVNAEVLLFGKSLEPEVVENTLVPMLDENERDSTEGEEDDENISEEDISKFHPDLLLYKAAAVHNLPVMCEALALGANKNWMNKNDKGRSTFHQAILSGSVMPCEYLILNGAKLDLADDDGITPLHLATELGHTGQVCLLLKHNARQNVKDHVGRDPLTIAMNDANADIVTLLRLARLNEEIRETECGIGGDNTFNEVVRDFSQMASNDPKSLVRRTDTKKCIP